MVSDSTAMELHPEAVALRPTRIVQGELRLYTAVSFRNGAWDGCEVTLRRCQVFGGIDASGQSDIVLDVLNESGDIVQDFALTPAGMEYLRRVLRFKVDHSLDVEHAAWREAHAGAGTP